MSDMQLALVVPSDIVEAIAAAVAERLAGNSPRVDRCWLNVQEAAAYLGCGGKKPEQRVYDLTSQGRLQHAKEGSRLLFRREWLDAIVEEGQS